MRACRAPAWVYIQVTDTGTGVAPEDRERSFHPFEQAGAELTRVTGGTGPGLTISRQFARLMGGDATLSSESDQGSCFTLWLPGAPQPSTSPALMAESAQSAR